MARVFLIVEGQTEEQFYKNTFSRNYVRPDGTYRHYFDVVVMPTQKNVYVRSKKGGRISYRTCLNNCRRFLAQNSHCDLVVLILDYYGLDVSFKDHLDPEVHRTLSDKVAAIQERLEKEIGSPRFKFRLQVHEFEAYLFSNPDKLAEHFAAREETFETLWSILRQFGGNPEAINDNKETAPSKRLEEIFPGFGKTTDGLVIAQKIGVDKIRAQCAYFHGFCKLIEA